MTFRYRPIDATGVAWFEKGSWMPRGQRSPFGDLVRAYRGALNLTQLELAMRASNPAQPDHDHATVSERTISAIERRAADPGKWTHPRPSTVKALINVFGLVPGTAPHAEFIEAAHPFDHDRPRQMDTSKRVAVDSSSPDSPEDSLFSSRQPFIPSGRELHLLRLATAIDAAVTSSPGIRFVSADPGTGKTWLIEEACRRAVDNHPNLVVLWSNSTGRQGSPDPYQAFRSVLGTMVGDIRSTSAQQLVSSANAARLLERTPVALHALIDEGRGLAQRFLPDGALRNPHLTASASYEVRELAGWLAEEAASLENLTINPNEQVFRSLLAYAEAGPTILVLEDLHWADIGTTTAISHLQRRLHQRHVPLLIIGSFRPADLGSPHDASPHPLPQLLRELPILYQDPIIDLSTSVGGAEGHAFVHAMAAQLGTKLNEDQLTWIFERTGGMPLFVNGIFRLYEQEEIGPDAVVESHHDAASVSLMPSEIDALFSEQLARLSPSLQNLLTTASVQGNGFSAEVLMMVLDLSTSEAISLIDDQLVRQHRLLIPGGSARIGDQTVHEYQFAHALLRDFIYARLSSLQRSHIHTATAEAMTSLYGFDHHDATDAIAYHLDLSGDRLRAGAAYLRGGNHSLNLSRFERAHQLFSRIGDLNISVSDPFTYAQSLVGMGACARALDRRAEARAQFAKAIDIAVRKRLPTVHANALASLGMLDYDAGEMRQGSDRLRRAIDLHLAGGDLHEACRSMARLSHNLHGMGFYYEAADAARRGIDLATNLGNDMMLVGARIALANCWIDIGLFEDAIDTYHRCIEVSEEYLDSHRVNICLLNIALCTFELEQWEDAEEAIRRMMEPGRSVVPRFIATGEFTLGITSEGRKDWDAASIHYQASIDIRQGNGQDALLIDSLGGLLRIAIARAQEDTARDLVSDITRRIDQRGLDGIEHVGRLSVSLVQAAIALEDDVTATSCLRQALDFVNDRATRLGNPKHRASYLTRVSAHRTLFELAAELGVTEG